MSAAAVTAVVGVALFFFSVGWHVGYRNAMSDLAPVPEPFPEVKDRYGHPPIVVDGHEYVSPYVSEYVCRRCGDAFMGGEPSRAMIVEPCPGVWKKQADFSWRAR